MRLLHVRSDFDAGWPELRAARLMNAFGQGVRHTVVAARSDSAAAAATLDRRIAVTFARDFPSLSGWSTPGRLQRLARAMRGFDLVLTYGWEAIDAVLAHTLFGEFLSLPPLVHHEDGSADAARSGAWRNRYRRVALGRAAALIVPDAELERVACDVWYVPASKVRRVADGVDLAALGRKAKADSLPRVVKRPGEKWLGAKAPLEGVDALPRLVRAFAGLPDEWQLVILGDVPARDALQAEALRLNIAHRLHLPGFVSDAAGAMGLFDLFVLTGEKAATGMHMAEAMAAGLAVVGSGEGGAKAPVAEANRPFLVPSHDETALAEALDKLAGDPRLRTALGAANKAKARTEFDDRTMIAGYRAVYAAALGRSAFP